MYSKDNMSGMESSTFIAYWDKIQNKFEAILGAGPRIRVLYNRIKNKLQFEKDPKGRAQLKEQLSRLSGMYINWQEVDAKISLWRSKWHKIASAFGADREDTGMGIIPFILPAWALATLVGGGLAALTYVSIHGLDLIKQYQAEQIIYNRLDNGKLSERGAKGLIEALQPKGMDPFQLVAGGVGNIIPMVAGVGLLFMFGPTLMARMAK